MELRELRYFAQIAKDGSYTKAAKSLYISQPALSKTIKKLESELQISLFEVKPNGVALTDYGQLFLCRILPLLEEIDALPKFTHDIQNMCQGQLNVGITPMLNQLYFHQIIVDFMKQYPNLELKLIESGTLSIHQFLLEGALDLGICIVDSNRSLDSRLSQQIILEDTMVIAMSENNPLSNQPFLRFEDLKNESFHSYSTVSALYSQLESLCSKAGFIPKISSSSSNVAMILQFTASGSGISLLPRPYAQRYLPSHLRSVPLQPPVSWRACLVKNQTTYQSYASRALEACIINHFRSLAFEKSMPTDQELSCEA